MAQHNQGNCLENHPNSLVCAGLLGYSSFRIACFLGGMWRSSETESEY